jgi:hypothetical protein
VAAVGCAEAASAADPECGACQRGRKKAGTKEGGNKHSTRTCSGEHRPVPALGGRRRRLRCEEQPGWYQRLFHICVLGAGQRRGQRLQGIRVEKMGCGGGEIGRSGDGGTWDGRGDEECACFMGVGALAQLAAAVVHLLLQCHESHSPASGSFAEN